MSISWTLFLSCVKTYCCAHVGKEDEQHFKRLHVLRRACVLCIEEPVALPALHNVHTEDLITIEPFPMSSNPVQHMVLRCSRRRGRHYTSSLKCVIPVK